jgi:protein SCO1/2
MLFKFSYRKKLSCLSLFGFGLLGVLNSADAQVIDHTPERLEKIDTVDHLGEKISLDYTFINEEGQKVRLGDYFNQGRPVILNLVYYRCPMLCTFVLNAVGEGLAKLPTWSPDEQYTLITISINPEETAEVAQAKKSNYAKLLYDLPSVNANEPVKWHFWVSPDNQVKKLAEELGFSYYYDEVIEEYAHPAVTYVLSPDGTMSRNLYGLDYAVKDLRFAVLEASKGNVGNIVEKVLLYCYRYDAEQGSYVLFAVNAMKLGGLFTIASLGLFLGLMWRYERKTSDQDHQGEHHA